MDAKPKYPPDASGGYNKGLNWTVSGKLMEGRQMVIKAGFSTDVCAIYL